MSNHKLRSPGDYPLIYALALEKCRALIEAEDGRDMDEWVTVQGRIANRTGIGGANSIMVKGGHWARSFERFPHWDRRTAEMFKTWVMYFRVARHGLVTWKVECRLRRRSIAADMELLRGAGLLDEQNPCENLNSWAKSLDTLDSAG